MDCKHIKREGESCPKNNNCRYPFCLADRNNNTTYCFKCGKTIDFYSNSGLCLTCSINTSTEGMQTPPSSGEGSEGKKNINTNDLPSNDGNPQVLHKAHVMRSLALLQQVLNRQAKLHANLPLGADKLRALTNLNAVGEVISLIRKLNVDNANDA